MIKWQHLKKFYILSDNMYSEVNKRKTKEGWINHGRLEK